MTIAALIVAAGKGLRAGKPTPKQWQNLHGKRVIDWTIAAFDKHPRIDRICVVLDPQNTQAVDMNMVEVAYGGETRRQSVLNGLEKLSEHNVSKVLIHDAARPCLSQALISSICAALDENSAAAPALPICDALWSGSLDAFRTSQPRDGLFRAQTPQAFALSDILAAHRAYDGLAVDDVEIAKAAGLDVHMVPGEETNIKITHPSDFKLAAQYLGGQMDIRIGSGFDVHRFGPGTSVRLCDVDITHDRGLSGHSDADVALHALCDAIYGALAAGDIGRHFPPSDPQWKGAESRIFLEHAVKLAADMGYRPGNIDVTLICEQPKITPHSEAMRTRLSELTGVDVGAISVKATTSEGLGFTGRKEGIAAQASVLMVAL